MITLSDYIKEHYDKRFDQDKIPFDIVQKTVKKGTIIYPYSKIGDKIYFLNQGIIETSIGFGEIEKTLSFIFKGNFFCSFASILTKTPSEIQGTAITDCVYEELNYSDYQKICERSILANKIGRKEVENYYVKKYNRERDLLLKSKEEMYLEMVKSNPEILKNIPLNKIANYFNIRPETLSRIRKKIV
ncbi:Crp/Fnr family transcriptional regulator [Aureivirga sp. CE67]|uniref:Crp/Fnr family transcriptional regulator n=1 Tax=Aureivirga sp. CE67 TaxID=1788983 RepID=UPI0018CA35E4|nr:Crp/Fnr family transcriptional regulator [Aureivirga sp. CE67]